MLTSIAAIGATQMDFEDDARVDFWQRSNEYRRLEQFYDDFGVDFNDVLIVFEGEDLFSVEAIAAIRQALETIRKQEAVVAVYSAFDVRRRGTGINRLLPLIPTTEDAGTLAQAKLRAMSHPLVANQFLSSDGTTMFAWVRLNGDLSRSIDLAPHLDGLQVIVQEASAETPVTIRMAGQPMVRVHALHTVRREMGRLMLVSAVISGAIALVLFRKPAAIAVSVSGPMIGMLWTIGLMGIVGEKINGLNAIVPTVVFVIGFTDSVHLIFETRRQMKLGNTNVNATRRAIRIVGPACAMTSLTTMVGFGSLLLADIINVRHFGAACASGTFLCFCSVITIAPLLSTTRLGKFLVAGTPKNSTRDAPIRSRRYFITALRGANHLLQRYRWSVMAASLIGSLMLAIGAMHLRPDIRWQEMLPQDSETVQVARECDEKLGGMMLAYVVVRWPENYDLTSPEVLNALADVHRVLDDEPTLRGSFSVLNILMSFTDGRVIGESQFRHLERMPTPILDRVVQRRSRQAVVTAHVPDIGAALQRPVFDRLNDRLSKLEEVHPGLDMHLTGTAVFASRNLQNMISDLGKSLAFASITIFLMMVVVFRSIRLGLISVIPNAFPLALIGGFIGFGGWALSLTSAMTFSVCIGIAVDDTIHFLSRFRRGIETGANVQISIARAYRTAGMAMFVTSVTLVGGFAAMMISSIPPIHTFGQLAAAAVVAALIGDLVILPALLLCFYHRTEPAALRRHDANES